MVPDEFALGRFYARHEFHMHHMLGGGDCESMTVADLLAYEDGALTALKELSLGYTEQQGGPGLRAAVSCLYDEVHPDEVLITAGAEEGIFLALSALVGPGDHVVAQSPCNQSLIQVAEARGAEVTLWSGEAAEDQWRFDLHGLDQALRPTTKLIVLNTPHCPTGFHFASDDFARIVASAASRGAYLFVDEVYRGLEAPGRAILPAAADVYDRAVSLGVMSKTYGLPGLRIGWLACRDAALLKKIGAKKDFTSVCCAGPSEFLATVALTHADELAERNREIITANRMVMDLFAARNRDRVDWMAPLAGPNALVRMIGLEDSDAYCETLAVRYGIIMPPGSCFGLPGNWVRIGLGRVDFPDALAAWEETLGSL